MCVCVCVCACVCDLRFCLDVNLKHLYITTFSTFDDMKTRLHNELHKCGNQGQIKVRNARSSYH